MFLERNRVAIVGQDLNSSTKGSTVDFCRRDEPSSYVKLGNLFKIEKLYTAPNVTALSTVCVELAALLACWLVQAWWNAH